MKNAKLIVFFNFLWMFIPAISIFIPFVMSLGLSMKDFFLLQSFFGLVVALMEVPSGYVADLFGRKKVVMFGAFLSGLGFIALYFSTKLWHLYVHEFFLALSISFMSGADYALLFDSLKEHMVKGERKIQAKWTSYFMMGSYLGEAGAGILSSILSFWSLSHVLFATMIVGWLPFVLSLFFEEVEVKKMEKSQHKENFKLVFSHMFKDSVFLRGLVFNFVVWSLSTMCVVWLIQKYWEENNLPLFWFGLLWAAFSIVGALSNKFSHALEEMLGSKVLFMVCALLVSLSYLLLAYAPFAVSFIIFPLFYVARGIFQPLFKEGFNHRVKEEFRATANSIYSLIFRLSFMVIGPLLGVYVDQIGLKSLFTALGVVFLLASVGLLLPFLCLKDDQIH